MQVVAVTLSDQATYSRLGVFVSILIARHCFPLLTFVTSVPISSLLKAWEDVKVGQISREAKLGARLSCHLLLMLFQSVEGGMASPGRPSYTSGIKHSRDRHLFAYSIRNIVCLM